MSRSPSEQASTNGLTESEIHRVLADERRQVALDVLSNRATPIGLEELAEAIVARDDDVEGSLNEHATRVAVTLHHQHLPIMTDVGAIRYDPSSRRVEAVDVTSALL